MSLLFSLLPHKVCSFDPVINVMASLGAGNMSVDHSTQMHNMTQAHMPMYMHRQLVHFP